MKTLGERIRELREAKDYSLREFARELNLSPSFFSDIELGRRFPSDEVLTRIAKELGEPLEKLRAHDTRPPVEELRRLAASNPMMGAALRRVAKKEVSAKQLWDFLNKEERKK